MSYQSWAYDKMQSEKETNKWIGAETEKDVGSTVQARFSMDMLCA